MQLANSTLNYDSRTITKEYDNTVHAQDPSNGPTTKVEPGSSSSVRLFFQNSTSLYKEFPTYQLGNAIDNTEEDCINNYGVGRERLMTIGFNKKIEEDCQWCLTKFIETFNRMPEICCLDIIYDSGVIIDEIVMKRDQKERLYRYITIRIFVADHYGNIVYPKDI